VNVARIAILAPTPDYEEDWSVIKADYVRLFGPDTAFLNWTDCGNLSDYNLVLPLLAWGYPRDYPGWLALLDRLEVENTPVANPVNILRWNSDKAYLAQLAEAGIATVPTQITDALSIDDLASARSAFAVETLVIKPPVSGGADGTYRMTAADAIPEKVAGKRMMTQPYVSGIATEGEFSLFYFGGRFSHAIIKRPAKGDFRVQDQFGGTEATIAAPHAAMLLAEAALSATLRITGTAALAYARVDMLRDKAGAFLLMELELIEPSLFLRFARDKGDLLADVIRHVLS
jgi:glutathione synthase/RimK-type ligase-like ATP-grasp enzyme